MTDRAWIAERLRQAAEILQAQGANQFKVAAYRKAAETIANSREDLRDILERQGRAGLAALPSIGNGIAAAVAEMLETGRWAQLERLRGSLDPASLFRTVPGIGPELALRIHDALGVETLEALEVASHDGRLDRVPGMGSRRGAMVRAALAEILGRPRPALRPIAASDVEPPVEVLLDVDREYRDAVAARRLRTIAPRRFNPEGESWLPVLHSRRGLWNFTALFSNTARAHELGRTHDWVVLYFDNDHHGERQRTIVTEQRGPLRGRRVVRGREAECDAHYSRDRSMASAPG